MTTNGLTGYQNGIKSTGNSAVYNPSTSIVTTPLTDKYTVGDNIGRGKFAVVRKCTNTETGEVLAGKFIKKRRRGKSCREEILREVVMLEMALDHPRLVNLKEVYETQQELILITEYCAGGELFTECILEEKFNESDVRSLMAQILEGLVYLHERKIVHLDLKPQNILLTEEFPKGSIKICDLGFACVVNDEDIRDIIGTPDYVAPEVLNYDPLGLYTDMWSLGVLTYVMLTTCSPFAGDDKQETFCNITTVNLEFPDDLFANISDDAVDFIQKLLVAEPSERMTAKECLQHEWLADLFPNTSESLLTPGLQELGFESELSPAISEHSNIRGRDKVENQTSEMSVSEVKEEGADTADDEEACSQIHQSKGRNTSNIIQLRHDDIVTPDSGIDDTFENKLNEIDNNVISESRTSQAHIECVDHEAEAVISENTVTDIKPEDSHWQNTDTDVKVGIDSDTNEDDEMLSSSGLTGTEAPETISKPNASDNSAYKSLSEERVADSNEEKIPETEDVCTDIHSSCESSDDHHSVMEHSGISESVNETEHITLGQSSQGGNVSGVDKSSVEQRLSVGDKLAPLTSVSNNSATDHLFTIAGRRSTGGLNRGDSSDQPQGTKGRHSLGISDPSSHSPSILEKHKLSSPNEMTCFTTPDKSEQTNEVEYEFVPVSKRVRSYEDSLSPTSPKIPRSPMINRHNRHIPH